MDRTLLFVLNEAYFFLSHRSPVARAARAVGWDVHVAAPPDHVWAPKGFSVDQIKAAGFEYHPIPLSRRGTNPIAEVRTFLALLRLYRRLRPDLVHHVTMKPNLYGGLAARLVGVPATVHAFTGLGHVFSGRGLRAAALRAIVRLLMRASLAHRNAYVVFQNTDDARQLVNRGIVAPERAHVIRGSGVDLGRFHPQAEPEGIPLVVLASRLIWDKGVGEFVEAARMLRRKGVEARFALVGDTHPTNPRSVPRVTLESWEREGVIEWWGYRDDMPGVLAQASIVCLPSTYGEGIPKVLLEAGAAGRPTVATDIAGCREVVMDGENGFLVPRGDAAALAARIEALAADGDLRVRMGRAARAVTEAQFAEEAIVAQTLHVYDVLTDRSDGAEFGLARDGKEA